MKLNFESKYIKLYILSSFIGATVGFIVSFYRMILYRLSVNVFMFQILFSANGIIL